ncbi:hypothetical protein H2198_008493 [Neophaeococcomyces mojaviensis]|uniref:Uncharacterized protein n=1 Tax=Neophaeococcomyces mojaviensis TaxID=3383035 RepID=A0ACC2ZXA8_9EURO|nr:hypothetical protein H2198_008493 [Knufia sp. JES_112]
MSVRVQLDLPNGDTYTNLDFVSGRVLLTLPTEAAISAITVKLEGESKTRLDGPKSVHDQDRRKTLLEVHKLLYKVETVFPLQEVRDAGGPSAKSAQYTIPRGQYEYPFKFKIPFNSDCFNNTSLMKDLKVGQLSVQFGQEPQHRKGPLPPSLAGYPGEAEIKYYVKATVVRPKFYQGNLRNEIPITFLPIEQPRPIDQDGETYGRRKHQFQQYSGHTVRRKSMFRQNSMPTSEEEPLSFQVDARLPNPAIITCREPLPLRILIERLNSSNSSIYLSMLQIELIGHTEVRAYDLQRKESGTWTLFSQANMSLPLEHPAAKRNSWTIPSRFWDTIPLPSTVAPTFSTCNISRKYELEVRVGLSSGAADGVRPEIIVSPIRLDVEVYSGIRPPPELLERHHQAQQTPPAPPRMNSLPSDSKQSASAFAPPNSPLQYAPPDGPAPHSSTSQQHLPLRPASHGTTSATPTTATHNPWTQSALDDLPPSYEDAIAEEIAPVDGPRREYSVRHSPTDSNRPSAFNPDSKSAGGLSALGRRVSERLFSQNAARPPGSRLSSRIASGHNEYGDDVLPEEVEQGALDGYHDENGPENFSVRRNENEAEHRPPLPTRRTSEQHAAGRAGGDAKMQAGT